jgi:hypothetical protein
MTGLAHLEFYTKYGISPVNYSKIDLQSHLAIRHSLYRSLGLLPLTIKDSSVLEIAAGSGQNSLYIATSLPNSLTLIEPNPKGFSEIQGHYADLVIPHTKPTLINKTLQEYTPHQMFDVVICENWLGTSSAELGLLNKLSEFVCSNGILVLTTISSLGILPNMIRRALMSKHNQQSLSFERQTDLGVEMFGSHLSNIKSMTRSAEDWVQDNMLNPAYFDICISIPDVIDQLGKKFTAVGTSPNFSVDWRWFKSLNRENQNYNQHLISQYYQSMHNFLDYQTEFIQNDIAINKLLEKLSYDFIKAVKDSESFSINKNDNLHNAELILQKIISLASVFPGHILEGLNEGLNLLKSNSKNHKLVSSASKFGRLFGKETIYLSLTSDINS